MPHPILTMHREGFKGKARYARNAHELEAMYASDENFKKLVDLSVAVLRGKNLYMDNLKEILLFGLENKKYNNILSIPLALINKKDQNKVDVFSYILTSRVFQKNSNLMVPNSWATIINRINPSWLTKIQELKKIEDTNKLEKHISRLMSKITKKKTMTIKSYIQSFITKDNIDEIMSRIDALRGEAELKIISSAEEASFVYAVGPDSCMKIKTDTSHIPHLQAMLKLGISPTSWYHYCPDTSIVYLKLGKIILARTVIYPKVKRYCYVYSETSKHGNLLKTKLKTEGYTRGSLSKKEWTETFKTPGFKVNKNEWVTPTPYLDDPTCSYAVSFDEDTKEFVWTPKHSREYIGAKTDDGIIIPIDHTRGYTSSNHVRTMECSQCNRKINAIPDDFDYGVITAKDGSIFCGNRCRESAGYVSATEAGNVKVYIPANEVGDFDIFQSGSYYTTSFAKEKLGGLPLLLHPSDNLDDCKLITGPFHGSSEVAIIGTTKSRKCAIPSGYWGAINNNISGLGIWKLGEFVNRYGDKYILLKEAKDGKPVEYTSKKAVSEIVRNIQADVSKSWGMDVTLRCDWLDIKEKPKKSEGEIRFKRFAPGNVFEADFPYDDEMPQAAQLN